MKRALATLALALSLAALPASSQAAQAGAPAKMGDLDLPALRHLATKAYALQGFSLTSGRLIYQGLHTDGQDPEMQLLLADFYLETQPALSAVMYWHLLPQVDNFGEELHDRFMASFCDAMYQFGLATRRDGKTDITIADIVDYGAWVFDFETLGKHAAGAASEFGSIDTFVQVLETALGMQVGFVEKKDAAGYADFMPEKVTMTPDWQEWLSSMPEDVAGLLKDE
jgi:hypothetical protein